MKKVISIALALVMMLAVCVPAFAAETENITITKDTPVNAEGKQTADAVIKTSTTGVTGSYTITIPAETVIPWSTTATSTPLNYWVSAQLAPNETLKVTVADKDGDLKMKDTANDLALDYTLDGDLSYTTPAKTVVSNEQKTININVSADAWNNAVVSAYSDTLTFTAEVVAA